MWKNPRLALTCLDINAAMSAPSECLAGSNGRGHVNGLAQQVYRPAKKHTGET